MCGPKPRPHGKGVCTPKISPEPAPKPWQLASRSRSGAPSSRHAAGPPHRPCQPRRLLTSRVNATCRRWMTWPTRITSLRRSRRARRRGSASTTASARTSCFPSARSAAGSTAASDLSEEDHSKVRQLAAGASPNRACVRRRSLSNAQKEVIVNGMMEVPTQAGDAVINEVRHASAQAAFTDLSLHHSPAPPHRGRASTATTST